MEPDVGQDLDAWRNVFGVRDVEGTKEKGRLSILKEKAARLMLKVVFGFRSRGRPGPLRRTVLRDEAKSIGPFRCPSTRRRDKGDAGAQGHAGGCHSCLIYLPNFSTGDFR